MNQLPYEMSALQPETLPAMPQCPSLPPHPPPPFIFQQHCELPLLTHSRRQVSEGVEGCLSELSQPPPVTEKVKESKKAKVLPGGSTHWVLGDGTHSLSEDPPCWPLFQWQCPRKGRMEDGMGAVRTRTLWSTHMRVPVLSEAGPCAHLVSKSL